MDMVGRCRRALTALQEKAARDREELAAWMRRHGGTLDSDVKKRADMMADSLRHTEDRVNEVRRRAGRFHLSVFQFRFGYDFFIEDFIVQFSHIDTNNGMIFATFFS